MHPVIRDCGFGDKIKPTRIAEIGILDGRAQDGGVLYGVALMLAFLESLLWGRIPYLPPCGNGKCKSGLLSDFGDYEPPEHDGEWGGYFWCRCCGRLYHRDRKKGRVLEVLVDGTYKPYMIWKSFRGWRPDESGMEPEVKQ